MANNARGHTVPAGSDASVTRQTIFETFGNSIRDVVPVANATARAQLVADLVAAGEGPSASKPLAVIRADAPGLHRLEYTLDGSVFIPASGVLEFASDSARDTWTLSYSGLLSVNDECKVGSVVYRWSGSTWLPLRDGMQRVTPAAVSGAGVSIGSSGEINLTAVPAGTTIQIRGIFSSLFRHYKIMSKVSAKVGSGYAMTGLVGTTSIGGTSYSFTRNGMIGGVVIAPNVSTLQANFNDPMFGDNGSISAAEVDVFSPNTLEATQILSRIGYLGGSVGHVSWSSNLNTSDQLTGLQIVTPAGGTTSARIDVYGMV